MRAKERWRLPGGDLWRDYARRYFFITGISPARFFSSGRHRSRSPEVRSDSLPANVFCLFSARPPSHAPHLPPLLSGGLYLNNIHELRYTSQIYCPRQIRTEDLHARPQIFFSTTTPLHAVLIANLTEFFLF